MQKSTWVFIAILSVIVAGGLAYRHFAQERDSRGATRLMRALEENDTEKMDKLLTKEEINLQDKAGQTPFFYAARHATEPKILMRLVLAGADPFARDKQGNTPLMTAARYNDHPEVVRALARFSREEHQRPPEIDDALRVAVEYNTAPVIKTLLIAQASPAAVREGGRSVAELLSTNERLSEQEKADLRQVMLLLEILEERAEFAKTVLRPLSGKKIAVAPKQKLEKQAPAPVKKEVPQKTQMPVEKQMAPTQISSAPVSSKTPEQLAVSSVTKDSQP